MDKSCRVFMSNSLKQSQTNPHIISLSKEMKMCLPAVIYCQGNSGTLSQSHRLEQMSYVLINFKKGFQNSHAKSPLPRHEGSVFVARQHQVWKVLKITDVSDTLGSGIYSASNCAGLTPLIQSNFSSLCCCSTWDGKMLRKPKLYFHQGNQTSLPANI